MPRHSSFVWPARTPPPGNKFGVVELCQSDLSGFFQAVLLFELFHCRCHFPFDIRKRIPSRHVPYLDVLSLVLKLEDESQLHTVTRNAVRAIYLMTYLCELTIVVDFPSHVSVLETISSWWTLASVDIPIVKLRILDVRLCMVRHFVLNTGILSP